MSRTYCAYTHKYLRLTLRYSIQHSHSKPTVLHTRSLFTNKKVFNFHRHLLPPKLDSDIDSCQFVFFSRPRGCTASIIPAVHGGCPFIVDRPRAFLRRVCSWARGGRGSLRTRSGARRSPRVSELAKRATAVAAPPLRYMACKGKFQWSFHCKMCRLKFVK